MPFQSSLSLYQCTLLPICTVATVQLLYAIRILSLYQCTLLPICTVAAVQLLYAIPVPTITISVHTVTNMYGSHSCYSHVPVLQYSYCMLFQSPLSLYQCTLLPICTVATAVTAMCHYCSTVTVCHSNPHCHYISAHCYQYVRQPQLIQPCASIAVQLYKMRGICWLAEELLASTSRSVRLNEPVSLLVSYVCN